RSVRGTTPSASPAACEEILLRNPSKKGPQKAAGREAQRPFSLSGLTPCGGQPKMIRGAATTPGQRRAGPMSTQIDANIVADRIRAVVRDEPKAFAYALGLSLSAVYNYMNGRIPKTDVLFRIARYTGQPMEWFLTPDQAAADAPTAVAA